MAERESKRLRLTPSTSRNHATSSDSAQLRGFTGTNSPQENSIQESFQAQPTQHGACLGIPSATSTASSAAQGPNISLASIWNRALQRLSSDEQEQIQQMSSNSPINMKQLYSVVEQKRNECERNKFKFNLNGRVIVLRDVVAKIMVWIDKFKEIGDVAANFDPSHAALPWAGVRFLLLVC